MPILGPDGQPVNLPRAIGAMKLRDFPPMPQEGLAELRGMVEHALAGGVPPEQTVAMPLANVAQILVTLEAATALLMAADSAAPPWLDAVDPDRCIPSPWTTRVTYWQDGTMQIERWHAPADEDETRIGVMGHGENVWSTLADARPRPPATLLQIGIDREPMAAIFPKGDGLPGWGMTAVGDDDGGEE